MEKRTKNRIWELDALRGLCILLMLFDHFMYNMSHSIPYVWADKLPDSEALFSLVQFAKSYWTLPLRVDIVQPLVVGIFFFISGICTEFSRSGVLRALKLVGVALLITVVTGTLDHLFETKSYLITAGVIHSFAFCALVHALLSLACSTFSVKVCNLEIKIKHIVYLVCAIICAILYLNADTFPVSENYLMYMMGFPARGFRSADSTFVMPWISVFLAGATLSPLLYPKKQSHLKKLDGAWNKPLCFVGKKSLWFYVLHQPVLYVLTGIVGLIFFGEFKLF